MFYKKYHLYSGSGDFKVTIHTNQGTTIALDVFPELSLDNISNKVLGR